MKFRGFKAAVDMSGEMGLVDMGVITSIAGKSNLKDQMTGRKEVVVKDKGLDVRKKVSVLQVGSGTRLYFRLQVANKGSEPVSDVVVDSPIPDRTSYVPDTAGGGNSEVLFSINGGKTYAGTEELTYGQTADPEMYSDIRWRIEAIQPGRVQEVYYQVHVQSLAHSEA